MNERGLVHPLMLPTLGSEFFPASAMIQAATESQADDGQVLRTWASVSGLSALTGRLGPASEAQERRLPGLVVVGVTHVLGLTGYYPEITTAHRAVVAETAYDILAVRHDGNSASTWLGLEVISG